MLSSPCILRWPSDVSVWETWVETQDCSDVPGWAQGWGGSCTSCPPAWTPGTGMFAANLELSGELKQLPLTSLSTAPQWKPLFLLAFRLFNLFCFKCCMRTSGERFGGSFLGPHLTACKAGTCKARVKARSKGRRPAQRCCEGSGPSAGSTPWQYLGAVRGIKRSGTGAGGQITFLQQSWEHKAWA